MAQPAVVKPTTLALTLPHGRTARSLADMPGLEALSDRLAFVRRLRATRPCVAILCSPPATADDIRLVAAERRRRRGLRVMLLDTADATAERVEALRAGFDEALDDRVDPVELGGRLALLAEAAADDAEPRRVRLSRTVVIDLERHTLDVNGRPVHLRPREFALLAVLARSPSRVFSRQELIDAVGATTATGELRSIDVHVAWLREKLDAAGDQAPELVSVRGVGYRLDRPQQSVGAVNRALNVRQQGVDRSA